MPRTEKTTCVVVDAFSTGKKLPLMIKGRGYHCIHVKSSASLPDNLRHNEKDFDENIVHGSMEETVAKLRNYNIKMCVPGYESGVELADALCQELKLSTSNGTEYSAARRDKFPMGEAVSKAGLKTVAQIASSSQDEIITWYRDEKRLTSAKSIPDAEEKTIVVKPLKSASGDSVFFCKDEKDIAEAFRKITTSLDVFGQRNTSVLAQNHNPGQEYIVNTVAYDGKVMVVEIYEITKLPGTTVYDQALIVDPASEEFSILSDYAKGVISAVHIRYGAATVELKYTPKGGPVLIEIAARMMGNSPLSFMNDLFGMTQLSMMVEAYLNPQLFMHLVLAHKPSLDKGVAAVAVVLISDTNGVLKEPLSADVFKKLPTFHSCMIDGEAGATLKKTTEVGEIYLLGAREAIMIDKATIRKIEADGYYRNAIIPQEEKTTSSLFPGEAQAGSSPVLQSKAPLPQSTTASAMGLLKVLQSGSGTMILEEKAVPLVETRSGSSPLPLGKAAEAASATGFLKEPRLKSGKFKLLTNGEVNTLSVEFSRKL